MNIAILRAMDTLGATPLWRELGRKLGFASCLGEKQGSNVIWWLILKLIIIMEESRITAKLLNIEQSI